MLNEILEHHIAGFHALPHEVSANIYIYIYIYFKWINYLAYLEAFMSSQWKIYRKSIERKLVLIFFASSSYFEKYIIFIILYF